MTPPHRTFSYRYSRAVLGGGLGRRAREKQRPRRELTLPAWLKVGPLGWAAAAAAMLAVVLVLAWALWPSDPPPRQREYRAETACLLTGEKGVAAPEAAPVWAGMQDASLATRVKIQYLEVDGPQTPENAETYLASLAQSRCDLILAVGAAPTAGLRAASHRFPARRFVGIGGGEPGDNVSIVDVSGPEGARAKAKELVSGIAAGED